MPFFVVFPLPLLCGTDLFFTLNFIDLSLSD